MHPSTDEHPEPAAVAVPDQPVRQSGSRWSLGVFALALVATLVIYHRLWADPFATTLGSRGHTNDPMQTMWNLKWVPWQLLHAHNPLSTHAMYYPDGVSLAWNTLTPTLGIVAAPITLTFGPAFSYALLMTLAPALSSLTAFWWLRRHVTRPVAAVVGALLIGFNPFMTGHMLGHLNLTFVALVPLMLMLFEDLLLGTSRSRRRTAVLLGVVTAAQAGISEELIILVTIAVALAIAAAAIVDASVLRRHVRPAIVPVLGAIAVFTVSASPLLVAQLFFAEPVRLHAAVWSANAADYVLPLPRLALYPGWTHATNVTGAENGAYVGPLLILVLGTGIAITWRDRATRIAAITLGALVVLSFGPRGPGGVPLPWRLVSGLPVLTSVLPVRFTFPAWFVIAWLLTRWLDALRAEAPTTAMRRRVAVVVGVASLAMLTPRAIGTYPLPHRVPFFTSTAMTAVIPRGSAVLLLPVPSWHDASGIYYQAIADFRFDQPGGYALRPDGEGVSYGPPDSPLVQLSEQATAVAQPPFDGVLWQPARQQLRDQHYVAIALVDSAPNAARLREVAERLTGRPADRHDGGVSLWLLPTG